MANRTVNPPSRGQQGFRKTHGMCRSPEYNSWNSMKHRCHNPNYPGYRKYGARGITVCGEWLEGFEAFYRDMGPKPGPDYSIERIDNNGPYRPDNCRWATRREQQMNRRNSIHLTLNGVTKPLNDWAEEMGVDSKTLRARVYAGLSDEDVITTPLRYDWARRKAASILASR